MESTEKVILIFHVRQGTPAGTKLDIDLYSECHSKSVILSSEIVFSAPGIS